MMAGFPLYPLHSLLVYLQETAQAEPMDWLGIIFDKPIHLVVIAGLSFALYKMWKKLEAKDKELAKANERAHIAHVQMLQSFNDFQLKMLERLDELKDFFR